MKRSPIVLGLSAVAVATLGFSTAAGAGTRSSSGGPSAPVVVVSGLNNPRQLSLIGHGSELLIAEAGKGGKTKISSPEGNQFIGDTGSISAVWYPSTAHDTTPNRIVRGLMSGGGEHGEFAVGSDGVSARSPWSPIYIQETYAPPDVLPGPLGSKQDGRLLKANANVRGLTTVANISEYEQHNDPDGMGFDSDPYSVLALRGGELVTDAAGNDVLWVDRSGHVSVFHVFHNITDGACAGQADPTPDFPGCNFVPTSLARDHQGHIYVGALGSEVPGEGRVVELSSDGTQVLRTITGFTSVTGVAVGKDGSVYVSQLEATEQNPPSPQIQGVLTRVARDGTQTNVDVPFPAGVAVDRHGNVYVSAWSVAPEGGLAGPGTSGQVWRLHF